MTIWMYLLQKTAQMLELFTFALEDLCFSKDHSHFTDLKMLVLVRNILKQQFDPFEKCLKHC